MIKVESVNPRWHFLVDRIESEIARDYTSRRDRNENGVVDKGEYSGSEDVFKRVDQNQNDRLELSEVRRYVDLLKQREPTGESEATEQGVPLNNGRSFSVSPDSTLRESVRRYYAEEVESLDTNGNGFVEADEFVGAPEVFSTMDGDRDSLMSPREWAEGFLKNQAEIHMALKAYRFSDSIFQTSGGVLRMAV